jgi:hypothetical protein
VEDRRAARPRATVNAGPGSVKIGNKYRDDADPIVRTVIRIDQAGCASSSLCESSFSSVS